MCLLCLLLFGCPYGSSSGCGGADRSSGCAQASSCAQAACGCRACTGYGRHAGAGVCGDRGYYERQYALCCKCSCCGN